MSDTPPNPDQVYSSVAELARWLHRDAVRVRLVIESATGEAIGKLIIQVGEQVKPASKLSDKAQEALGFLRTQPAGQIVKSRTLAAEIDLEQTGGQYRKVLAELVAAGLVETLPGANGGVRLLE